MAEQALARYEVLVLTVPEITADESSALESQIHSVITGAKGEVLSFERWGKYRLAYRVRNNEYGVYFLARFDLPMDPAGSILEEVKRLCLVKYRDLVMRHLIARLDSKNPLTYKRPESLEEMPRRDADTMNKPYGESDAGEMGIEGSDHDSEDGESAE
jgi:ribosomal protein S6